MARFYFFLGGGVTIIVANNVLYCIILYIALYMLGDGFFFESQRIHLEFKVFCLFGAGYDLLSIAKLSPSFSLLCRSAATSKIRFFSLNP